MLERRQAFYDARGNVAIPRFESAEFSGSVRTAKLLPSGDMELTINVPMSEKYNAMALTDAVGIMVLFRAERRRPSQARLMLLTENKEDV